MRLQRFIRDNAELGVRALLKRTAAQYGNVLSAVDYMDDGSPVRQDTLSSSRPLR